MKQISKFIKVQLMTWLLTGVLLIILSYLKYFFDLPNEWIDFSILMIYFISCLLGGIVSVKVIAGRRFLIGVILGAIYFLILLIISLIFQSPGVFNARNILTILSICVGSGMLGAMLCRRK